MSYVEDLKLGTNKDIGPKGIFEMASDRVLDWASIGYYVRYQGHIPWGSGMREYKNSGFGE